MLTFQWLSRGSFLASGARTEMVHTVSPHGDHELKVAGEEVPESLFGGEPAWKATLPMSGTTTQTISKETLAEFPLLV